MKAILKTPPDQAAIARLSEDPQDNSTLHTTCVATRLDAGHANNALPQRAPGHRQLPDCSGPQRRRDRQELVHAFNDPKIEVKYIGAIGEVTDRGSSGKLSLPHRCVGGF